MKRLKLDHTLAESVVAGKKRSTWRINDDKNLSVNDEVELVDKANPQDPTSWRAIGVAKLDQVVEKRMGQITEQEHHDHGRAVSFEQIYDEFREYYGNEVGPDTVVKIIHFSFAPYAKPRPLETIDVKESTKLTEVKMYADGGSRGNPGPSASGYVVLDLQDKVIKEGKVYLGLTTNNQAEYQALKFGLEEAHRLQAKTIYVYMDSLLVINQMKGIFKVKNRDLWPIHQAIKDMLPQFKHVTFTHVPREMNKLADRLVNEALDEVQGR